MTSNKEYWCSKYSDLTKKTLLPESLDLQKDSDIPFLECKSLESKTQKNILESYKYPESEIKENTKFLKTIKIQIYPKIEQIMTLKGYFDVCRYVYNKGLEYIKKKNFPPNSIALRNYLVTKNTRMGHPEYSELRCKIKILKSEKPEDYKKKVSSLKKEFNSKFDPVENPEVKDFEKVVPKDLRENSIRNLCNDFKTAKANLKAGNIKKFDIKFKKKTQPRKCIELDKETLKISHGKFYLHGHKYDIGKRNMKKYQNLSINHNCDLMYFRGKYYIYIPVEYTPRKFQGSKCCGIDPGLRTFCTVYSENEVLEYKITGKIKEIDQKIRYFKSKEFKRLRTKRLKKRYLSRLELLKKNLTDQIHWNFIDSILKKFDVVFFGDIKSHNIVKNGVNKTNNTNFMNIKFFKLKQKLVYKAFSLGKRAFLVNEYLTSQCCSKCGQTNSVGSSETYNCSRCLLKTGRDLNAAKNILLKGIITFLVEL
jgi:IS605 OrfB family transposase